MAKTETTKKPKTTKACAGYYRTTDKLGREWVVQKFEDCGPMKNCWIAHCLEDRFLVTDPLDTKREAVYAAQNCETV